MKLLFQVGDKDCTFETHVQDIPKRVRGNALLIRINDVQARMLRDWTEIVCPGTRIAPLKAELAEAFASILFDELTERDLRNEKGESQ